MKIGDKIKVNGIVSTLIKIEGNHGLFKSYKSLTVRKLNAIRDCEKLTPSEFNEGDRVFVFEFGETHEGTIYKNTKFPEVSEWFIKFDYGEECAVLDINAVYKLF